MEDMGTNVLEWVRFIAVLIAAGLVGNWYMSENKKNKDRGGPWYGAYFSIPGIIIVAAIILVPAMLYFLKK